VFILQTARLTDVRNQLEDQRSVNAALEADIAGLQEFEQLKNELASRQALSDQALQGQVLWSGVLRDVSMVIPGEMWLTGMTGSLSDTTGAALAGGVPATPGLTPIIGTIQFQGYASRHPTVAKWLTRLEQVTGWENPWISNSTETDFNGEPKVQWSGTIDLTTEATVQGRKTQ
jgi:Tfp pilus assembly protein PilN